jgi:hypothetical protein
LASKDQLVFRVLLDFKGVKVFKDQQAHKAFKEHHKQEHKE